MFDHSCRKLTADSYAVAVNACAHTHRYCETMQALALDMALFSPVCEAAKLGLHKDFEVSSRVLIVAPSVNGCMLASTTILSVSRHCTADAEPLLSGELPVNALLPHGIQCCLKVNTRLRKILPQEARRILCKRYNSVAG